MSGWGVVRSRHVVGLPEGVTSCAFTGNGISFRFAGNRLQSDERTWDLPAGGHIEVDVDALAAGR